MEFLKKKFAKLSKLEREDILLSYFSGYQPDLDNKRHSLKTKYARTKTIRTQTPKRAKNPLTEELKADLRKKLRIFTKRQLYDGTVILKKFMEKCGAVPPVPNPTLSTSKNQLIDDYLTTLHACWNIYDTQQAKQTRRHRKSDTKKRGGMSLNAVLGIYSVIGCTILYIYYRCILRKNRAALRAADADARPLSYGLQERRAHGRHSCQAAADGHARGHCEV